jgi:DNA helicase II / ATP-dependent DNA helicase PcrA
MGRMNAKQWLGSLPEELLYEVAKYPAEEVKLLVGLNPSQLRAVLTLDGPVQINAVAGSGKTRVLTHRIAWMLKRGIKPSQILCTTFTKKATEEMETRLGQLIPKMALKQITLGTTHSIGYRILAKEYENMGNPMMWAFKKRNVLMNGKQKIFVDKVIKDITYDRTVQFQVKDQYSDIATPQLLKAIGLSKNEGIGWEEYEQMHTGKGPRMEAYIEFYKRYELKKQSEKAIDGDDMLYLLWKLFKENPDILKKYQGYYKYLLVDEAQDNNGLQYELIRMLGAPEYNTFVVGDDDQSMYGFRGAKPEEFINFTGNYRGAKQIALEDNYRSNPGILNVANSLIKNNSVRLTKSLKAHKQDDSECVSYSAYSDETEEARGTVEEIKQLIDNEGYNPKQIAILYRTNAQSRAMEDQLIMSGLPYVIHGGVSFYERKEVKDIVSYLKMAVDPKDDNAFKRIYNVPSRYLGKAFYEKVKAFSGYHWEAISDGVLSLKDYEKRGVKDIIEKVNNLATMIRDNISPSDMLDYILSEEGVDYKRYILGEEEEEESSRMENIETLRFVLSRYERLEDFLNYIDMMTSKAKHSIDGVQLMTFHKSKGLEYPVAFNIGVSDGLLPHFRSIEDSENGTKPLAVEEERRLLYVGITRAESLCYLSSVGSFNGRFQDVSRFIPELGLQVEDDEVERMYQEKVMEPMLREHRQMMNDVLED